MPAKEKKRGRDKQSNAKAKGQIAVPTGGAKRKIEVLYCCDLKYAAPPSFYEVTIAQCAREGCSNVEDKSDTTKVFKCCGQLCGTRYCSRECQVKDWKKGKHKKLCPLIKEMMGDINHTLSHIPQTQRRTEQFKLILDLNESTTRSSAKEGSGQS